MSLFDLFLVGCMAAYLLEMCRSHALEEDDDDDEL